MIDSDQNQRRTEDLAAKVSRLKNVTLEMDKELKSQNTFLNSVGFDFDSTQNLVTGSLGRINGMMKTGKGNRKLMFYMIIVVVFVFFGTYKFLTRA